MCKLFYYLIIICLIVFFYKLQVQSTLTGVAQAVVDHIARIYHDTCEAQDTTTGATRPNIMLMVRTFNFTMPNGFPIPQDSWNGLYNKGYHNIYAL